MPTVRKRLRLPRGHFPAALAAGLLIECHRGHIPLDIFDRAYADPLFPELAAAEVGLNATDAAARAGVTIVQFRRAVAAGAIISTHATPWKFGNSISWFRTGDVDALAAASWWAQDGAERIVAAVANRVAGARKAAATRKVKAESRLALAVTVPDQTNDPFAVIAWSVAVLDGLDCWWDTGRHADELRWLPGYLHGRGGVFGQTYRLVQESRFNVAEAAGWATTARQNLGEAGPKVQSIHTAALHLQVGVHRLREQMPSLGCMLVRNADLQSLCANPPEWVQQARIDLAIEQMENGERQKQQAIEQQLAAQVRAASPTFIPLEEVAQIFGIPAELLGQWRERWSPQYVENLRRSRPTWLASPESLVGHIQRKADRRDVSRSRKAGRRASRREEWSQILAIPIAAVPRSIGNPTDRAVAAVRRDRPAWSLPVEPA